MTETDDLFRSEFQVTTITLNACRTLGDAFSHHSIILYP